VEFSTKFRRFRVDAVLQGAGPALVTAPLYLEIYSALSVPVDTVHVLAAVDKLRVGDQVLPFPRVLCGGLARTLADLTFAVAAPGSGTIVPVDTGLAICRVPGTAEALREASRDVFQVSDLWQTMAVDISTSWVLGDGSFVIAAPDNVQTCVLGFGTKTVPAVGLVDFPEWWCPGYESTDANAQVVVLRGVKCLAREGEEPQAALLCNGVPVASTTSRVVDVRDGYVYTLELIVPTQVLRGLDPHADYTVMLGTGVQTVSVPAVCGVVRMQLLPDGGQVYDADRITVNYLGNSSSVDPVYRDYQVGPYETIDDTRIFLSNTAGVLTVSGPGTVVVGFLPASAVGPAQNVTKADLALYAASCPITFVASASGKQLGSVLVVCADGRVTDVEGAVLVDALAEVTSISLKEAEVQGSEDFLLVTLQEPQGLTQVGGALLSQHDVVAEVCGLGFVQRFRTVNNVPVFTSVETGRSLLTRKDPAIPTAPQFPDSLRLTLEDSVIANEQDVANLLYSLEARPVSGTEWWVLATNAVTPGDSPVSSADLVALLEGVGPTGHPWPERSRVYDSAGVYCMWEADHVLQYRLMVQNAVAKRLRNHPLVQVGEYNVQSHRGSATVMQYNDYQASAGQVIRFLVPDGCEPGSGTALVQAHSKKLATFADCDVCYFETVSGPNVTDGYILTKNGATETHIVDTHVFSDRDGGVWAMIAGTVKAVHYVRVDVRAIVSGTAVSGTCLFAKNETNVWTCMEETATASDVLSFSVDSNDVTTTIRAIFKGSSNTRVCAVLDVLTV
jgi:hypothetical protein